MPEIDPKYLRNLPSSDPYGDEDGFDMDIDDWTDDELDDGLAEMEYQLLNEYPHYSRSKDGYLCSDLSENPALPFQHTEESQFAEMESQLLKECGSLSVSEAGYLCCNLDGDQLPF